LTSPTGLATQRTVGSLVDLPVLAAAASIGPPATLVVGGVAGLAREIAVPFPAEAAEVRLGG
jgi:hypothetical protein